MVLNISEFRRLRGMTLSSQIVAHIRDAIFAGSLKSGDVLGCEADLANQFGVSRMSIRDALRSLEAMGIVEIRTGAKGGAVIAEGNSDRYVDAIAFQHTEAPAPGSRVHLAYRLEVNEFEGLRRAQLSVVQLTEVVPTVS